MYTLVLDLQSREFKPEEEEDDSPELRLAAASEADAEADFELVLPDAEWEIERGGEMGPERGGLDWKTTLRSVDGQEGRRERVNKNDSDAVRGETHLAKH